MTDQTPKDTTAPPESCKQTSCAHLINYKDLLQQAAQHRGELNPVYRTRTLQAPKKPMFISECWVGENIIKPRPEDRYNTEVDAEQAIARDTLRLYDGITTTCTDPEDTAMNNDNNNKNEHSTSIFSTNYRTVLEETAKSKGFPQPTFLVYPGDKLGNHWRYGSDCVFLDMTFKEFAYARTKSDAQSSIAMKVLEYHNWVS